MGLQRKVAPEFTAADSLHRLGTTVSRSTDREQRYILVFGDLTGGVSVGQGFQESPPTWDGTTFELIHKFNSETRDPLLAPANMARLRLKQGEPGRLSQMPQGVQRHSLRESCVQHGLPCMAAPWVPPPPPVLYCANMRLTACTTLYSVPTVVNKEDGSRALIKKRNRHMQCTKYCQ